MYHHTVTGLANVKSTFEKSTHDYGCGFRSHVEAYWIAKKIVVISNEWSVSQYDKYIATLGDYDLDCKLGYGTTKDEAIEELLIALDDESR